MEIERKWLVNGWPEPGMELPLLYEESMRQGYISVRPTVRIREEARRGGDTEYILCFKSAGSLAREEIEFPIKKEQFAQLEDLIGLPLIPKTRKTYQLPDGLHLEVNRVDADLPSEFWYAEIEFETEEQAISWAPEEPALAAFLSCEVTNEPGQTMGAYWLRTRGAGVQ